MDFWILFTSTLSSLMLTAMFIWGMVAYHNYDRAGKIADIPMAIYIGIFLPQIFLVLGFAIVFGF